MSAGVSVDWDGSEREIVLKVRKRKEERIDTEKQFMKAGEIEERLYDLLFSLFWLVQR